MDHLCLRVIDFDFDGISAHLESHGSTGEAVSLYLSNPEGKGWSCGLSALA